MVIKGSGVVPPDETSEWTEKKSITRNVHLSTDLYTEVCDLSRGAD